MIDIAWRGSVLTRAVIHNSHELTTDMTAELLPWTSPHYVNRTRALYARLFHVFLGTMQYNLL